MTSAADMIADLRAWVLACGVPRKSLAKTAGLSPGALWSADSSEWNPTADTIRKLDELRAKMNRLGSASSTNQAA